MIDIRIPWAYNIDRVADPIKTVLVEVAKPAKIALIEVAKPAKIVLIAGIMPAIINYEEIE